MKKYPLESWEQKEIFLWSKRNETKYPVLKYMYGSLSGFRLSPKLRKQSKQQGSKKGIPDIDLPSKSGIYSGLHIELKRVKNGKVSEEQKDFIKHLMKQGRFACICNGHEAAIEVIENYLEGTIDKLKGEI